MEHSSRLKNYSYCCTPLSCCLISPVNFFSGAGYFVFTFLNFWNCFLNFKNFLNLAESISSHAFFYVIAQVGAVAIMHIFCNNHQFVWCLILEVFCKILHHMKPSAELFPSIRRHLSWHRGSILHL